MPDRAELMSTDNCLFEYDNFYDTFYGSFEKTDCWKCLRETFKQPLTKFSQKRIKNH